jgi:hypothetical protein
MTTVSELEEYETVELTDDVLAHFGVKGMHWGVKRAASAVTAPGRRNVAAIGKGLGGIAKQGNKNVHAIGNAVGKAHAARVTSLNNAATKRVDKHGELGAATREAGRAVVLNLMIHSAGKKIAKDIGPGNPRAQVGVQVAAAALRTAVSVKALMNIRNNDRAANRINAAAGNPKGQYVDRASKR